jgi:hypothetical protein
MKRWKNRRICGWTNDRAGEALDERWLVDEWMILPPICNTGEIDELARMDCKMGVWVNGPMHSNTNDRLNGEMVGRRAKRLVSTWANGWKHGWVDRWLHCWMSVSMKGWRDSRTNGWVPEWITERMVIERVRASLEEWIHAWMDGRVNG